MEQTNINTLVTQYKNDWTLNTKQQLIEWLKTLKANQVNIAKQQITYIIDWNEICLCFKFQDALKVTWSYVKSAILTIKNDILGTSSNIFNIDKAFLEATKITIRPCAPISDSFSWLSQTDKVVEH